MNTDLWVIVKESNIKKLINIDKIKGDCGRNKFKKENGQVLAKLIKDIKPFFHKCLQTPCSIIIKINHTQIHHSKCFGNQKERINEREKKTFLLKVYRTHTHTSLSDGLSTKMSEARKQWYDSCNVLSINSRTW